VTGRSGSQLTLLNSTSRALAKVKEAKTNRRLKAGDMVDGCLSITNWFYESYQQKSEKRFGGGIFLNYEL
jgi:hypothetical protein